MRVDLIGQPDATSSSLHEFLTGLLGDPEITRFVAVTAWINHRGLSRLVPALRSFRARGIAEVIVGIDEGGATEQGLRLAAIEFDRASVFFTSEDRTFHPKLYLGTGAEKALLFVGSNNLTPGGLFFNFEAALAIEVPLGVGATAQDTALAVAAESYVARLYDDTDVCKPLGPNLESIIRDPTYRVKDEAAPRARLGTSVVDPDADREPFQRSPLFGRSSRALKRRVPPGDPIPPSSVTNVAANAAGRRVRSRPQGPVAGTPAKGVNRAAVGARVQRRWFRPLDATAAQHPPDPASSPTGNLRLTQADHAIDQTSYFRTEFYGGAAWTGSAVPQGTRETALVPMEVVIDGRSLGAREFLVSHASWREAHQGNVTTVIHLSPIAAVLRNTNYTGRVVTLEQLVSGGYRIVIDTSETGPFVR